MKERLCYCDTGLFYEDCCGIYHKNKKAPTALALMRSRYSAYASHQADYLLETTHISERRYYTKVAILDWATSNQWLRLEILNFTENTVEFKAYYLDEYEREQIHHEFSTFKKENEQWFFVNGR